MKLFNGQVAVITGGGSGIGRAVAETLVREGASVCLVGRSKERLSSVASALQIGMGLIRTYAADLCLDEDIYALIDTVKRDFGRLNLLIHSAGDFSMGPVESSPIADFDRQFRINLRAPFLVTQGMLPMIRASQGQIVFINSSAGLNARAGVGQYAATKHGLRALADSLRGEVNADGIRVLTVYPGRTATPLQEIVHRLEGRPYDPSLYMQPEDVASAIINALAIPRSAEVTDINIRPMRK